MFFKLDGRPFEQAFGWRSQHVVESTFGRPLVHQYERKAPQAMRVLESALTVMQLPERLRTTNTAERTNAEIRRRERAVRLFPSEEAAVRLTRSFNPKTGQNEDAATGVGAGTLASIYCQTFGVDGTIVLEQGDNIGRQSRMFVSPGVNKLKIGGYASIEV